MLKIFIAFLALAMGSNAAFAEAPALQSAKDASTVSVFAAASLKDALDPIAGAFTAKTGIKTKISYGGSMALAKQIEAGAPADVFLSADQASMDYLAGKSLIRADSRANLLGNTLVIIAPRGSKLETLPLTGAALTAALGSGKITTGDVTSVPVGKYAKAALENLGLWSVAEGNFAFTDNVRSALIFVARDEAPLGIVYATDAKSEPKVKIVATIPANAHPPIVYPVALTSTASGDGAARLLSFIKSKEARGVFMEKGFSVLKQKE